ncbi:hypothetical protein [Pleionea mediterranea]|jgi:hypothetical protein|uniref:Uncharacterized protein n=1 Tax=Pleionea mediterranea TaxID=523701 RepID=A0A316FPD8_9GAMM|nr:hypothetical protein [Pleionea mediterranea]PWK49982.1 hypothetical protein C8D97_107147 [Pleionea mediterranea]
MSIYDFEQLMSQTRQLASQYREATGQSLPVTVELARFDAITLLGLTELSDTETEALLIENDQEKRVQIKGRVIFPGGKSRQRVGQLNLQSEWDYTLLVIYDADYQPSAIYRLAREIAEQEMASQTTNKRGAMTVAKFKAIGESVWERPEAKQSESL